MNRDQAKEYVMKVLKTRDKETIKLVLNKYIKRFIKLENKPVKEDSFSLYQKVFGE